MEKQHYRLGFSEKLKDMGKKLLELMLAKQKRERVLNHKTGRGRRTLYTYWKGVSQEANRAAYRDMGGLETWSRQRRRRFFMDVATQQKSAEKRQARLDRQQARRAARKAGAA